MRNNSFIKCRELIHEAQLMYNEFKKNSNLCILARQEYETSKKQVQNLINKTKKHDKYKYIKKK